MNTIKIKWTKGNSKLKKTATVGFGLPAFESASGFKVCPQAGACAAVCYARQGSYTWPATKNAREHNLAIVKPGAGQRARLAQFVDVAVGDLRRMRFTSVRIHDSGDFFDQDYYSAWEEIARALPKLVFYAYTKSLHLDMTFPPENFRITFSEGGKMDHLLDKELPHSRIFSTVAARVAAGYVDGNKSDLPAMNGEQKIGLVYHGTRKMTDAQVKAFA